MTHSLYTAMVDSGFSYTPIRLKEPETCCTHTSTVGLRLGLKMLSGWRLPTSPAPRGSLAHKLLWESNPGTCSLDTDKILGYKGLS